MAGWLGELRVELQGGPEMAADSNVIDVDASYDPASGLTLDEHRQQTFQTIQQIPFGTPKQAAQPKAE